MSPLCVNLSSGADGVDRCLADDRASDGGYPTKSSAGYWFRASECAAGNDLVATEALAVRLGVGHAQLPEGSPLKRAGPSCTSGRAGSPTSIPPVLTSTLRLRRTKDRAANRKGPESFLLL